MELRQLEYIVTIADEQSIAKAAQNQGFRELARHETGENPVGNGADLHHSPGPMGRQEGEEDPPDPPDEMLFFREHVYGEDHAHDQGEHSVSYRRSYRDGSGVEIPHKVRGHLAGLANDGRPVDLKQVDLLRVYIEQFQLLGYPGFGAAEIGGDVFKKLAERINELRDDKKDDGG